MNNFYRIKYNGHRLSSDTFNLEHERCLQFVKKAVSESIAKFKITLTHHVPTGLLGHKCAGTGAHLYASAVRRCCFSTEVLSISIKYM